MQALNSIKNYSTQSIKETLYEIDIEEKISSN